LMGIPARHLARSELKVTGAMENKNPLPQFGVQGRTLTANALLVT